MRPEFWRHYRLDELDSEEWEALCDGCALCCMHKLEDEDSARLAITHIACKQLNISDCSCLNYQKRHVLVADCLSLNPERASSFRWLPDTCAYKRMANAEPLPYWHYLETGDRSLVHSLAVSALNNAIPETSVPEDEWQDHVVRWVD